MGERKKLRFLSCTVNSGALTKNGNLEKQRKNEFQFGHWPALPRSGPEKQMGNLIHSMELRPWANDINQEESMGTRHCSALDKCYIFYKLKSRAPTKKKITTHSKEKLALLSWWSGTEPAASQCMPVQSRKKSWPRIDSKGNNISERNWKKRKLWENGEKCCQSS